SPAYTFCITIDHSAFIIPITGTHFYTVYKYPTIMDPFTFQPTSEGPWLAYPQPGRMTLTIIILKNRSYRVLLRES
ncbi:hypothetical protein STEG23_026565, partial [Scotinomys teguina]